MAIRSLTWLDARGRHALAATVVAALAATGIYAVIAAPASAAVPTCMAPGSATITPDATTTPGTTVVVVLPASGQTTVDIPPNVSSYRVDACGGAGGDSVTPNMLGGAGGRVTTTVPVGAPVQLAVIAGSAGGNGTTSTGGAAGSPSAGSGTVGGGGGGGFSGVFNGSVSQANAVVVAGGGGGGGLSASGNAARSAAPTTTGMQGESAADPGTGGGGGGYNGGTKGNTASTGGQGGSNFPGGLADNRSTAKAGAVVISYATPRAPTFTNVPITYIGPEGMVDTWTVVIDASPVATLALTDTPTASITFTDNRDNTGSFAISPTTPIGTYRFTVHASNVLGSADQVETFTIASRSASSATTTPSATATATVTTTPSTSATPSASASASSSATPSASASPSASRCSSTSPSGSASPARSASASATASSSPSGSASASGSAAPTGSATGSASATPTASISTSRSPSATACPSVSASRSDTPTATIALPQLTVITPDIQPGQPGRLHLTAPPHTSVQLFCYTRPGTTYRQVRPNSLGQGITVGDSGSIDFSVLPGSNTRCKGQYTNAPASGSNAVVIHVHTTLSLSAYRDGERRYHFQGRNLPRIPGQLITLYRLDRSGREIRTATTRTNTSGIWRINRRFTGSGAFRFVARTSQTLNNAAGKSNVRLTVVH